MLRIDVHQHLWSERLVDALAARRRPPYVRRDGRRWKLTVPGEAASAVEVDRGRAAERLHLDGLDLAMLSLSSLLGVEALPRDEAAPLLGAYHDTLDELPGEFRGWGALPLREAVAADVDRVLARGACGVCIPAGAIATPAGIERLEPMLARIEQRGAPLFVHPGPDPFEGPAAPVGGPAWFPALTSYVASMNAAWHAFVAVGRSRLRRLQVVFAMLAGGAPLHLERLTARGGSAAGALDRRLFYDTSSYGSQAIAAMVGVVGLDQLLHGSDRPVVAPPAPPGPLGSAGWEAMTRTNPARVFGRASRRLAQA